MPRANSIVENLHTLIFEHRFAPAYPLWSKNITSLCRAIPNSKHYCYIIITTNKDNSLTTDLWVGPINYPDSSLDSNCSAFKIAIGITHDEDPDFLSKCQQRIIKLIPYVDAFANAVQEELLSPSLVATSQTTAQRMIAYHHFLEAYDKLKQHQIFPQLHDELISLYRKGGKSLSKTIKNIKNIAPDILNNTSQASSDFLKDYLTPPFDLSSILAEFAFIETSARYAAQQPITI
ncbi:Imm25 family immunity protein [Pseudomonas sp. MWU16-30323]|uniref:Imm25 family immunity protein n=1 Tax=Pseudomonas sp. MWU16-30323 TaxID=2878094 RepID=UPI001CFA45B2|nr:Imm25 family immunity protein [Pseudomonas sp. MWU16-30323]